MGGSDDENVLNTELEEETPAPTEGEGETDGTKEGGEGEEASATGEEAAVEGDADLDAIRKQVADLEEEAQKLEEIQSELASQRNDGPEADARSIYVGNVDYGTTPEALQAHFESCGTINRVTILVDKWTGHPKGFAYVEFAETDGVTNSLALNESLFRGRQLKVSAKRTNVPGMGAPRGRGRGRGRGFFGGGFRGRGRGRPYRHHPYY